MSVIDQMHQHRSIRTYKPDPVPETLLNELLAAGIRASSSGNMQTYSIIVTRDRGLREQLLVPHKQQRMVIEAPVLVTFCADLNRMRHWLRLNEAPDGFDSFLAFMVATIDAVLVSQNVALAAESKGLGICYMGSTFSNCTEIGRILKLPLGVVPVVGFSLGHPAENPPPRDRLPLTGLVHAETYQEYDDERILEVFKERNVKGWERYMESPRLRALIEDSGVANLAQVYSVVKYPRATYQKRSRKVLEYLEQQGFMDNGTDATVAKPVQIEKEPK